MSRPIEIVGGGLAGLTLGRALAGDGVEVTILEAKNYPRHRVCGEFLCGLREETVARLHLKPILADALQHHTVAWHWRERPLRRDTLPRPALGLSRHALDARLARAFTDAGGTLRTHVRVAEVDARPGRIWATGRRTGSSRWLGLKVHSHKLTPAADLEFHFGDGAYVGLSAVEGDEVNVCGLFRQRPGLRTSPEMVLCDYLRASGLRELAARVAATQLPETRTAVGAVSFDREAPHDRAVIGDAFAMIPPFTGDGMAMAFESAAIALDPVRDFARGVASWDQTVARLHHLLRERFRSRLTLGCSLQRVLMSRAGQAGFALLARSGLLPFRLLFNRLH